MAKAFQEFDETGRRKPSAYCERVVNVMEELLKFTLLTRDVASYLVDRYSERRESAAELSQRVNQRSICSDFCRSGSADMPGAAVDPRSAILKSRQ